MAGPKIETAQRIFTAVAQRDLGQLLELTDPEVEWRSFFAFGEEGGVYRGHDGIRRYVSDLNDAWEIVSPTIDGTLEIGPILVIAGRLRYQGKGSGAGGEDAVAWVCKFRDDKLLAFRAFREPEQVFERLGLVE